MKLTSRTLVIWQLNEMTCYGVQPKMLMPTRRIMIFFNRTILIVNRMRKL